MMERSAIEILKGDLEDNFKFRTSFSELKQFYLDAFNENYKYIIIIPRKCLTEFKCIKLIGAFDEIDERFSTSKGIALDKRKIIEELRNGKLSEKSILIMDDIMIHGRGINKNIKYLMDLLEGEQDKDDLQEKLNKAIYVSVFAESNLEHLIDYNYIFDNNYSTIETFDFSGVKELSDLFLLSFYTCGIPNTSYVRSWSLIKGQNQLLEIIEENLHLKSELQNNLNFSDMTTLEMKKQNFYSCILYEKENSIFDSFGEFASVRLYFNTKINSLAITPYVFLPSLTKEQINSIFNLIRRIWGLEEYLTDDFISISDDDYMILKYEYITQFCSDIYGIYIYNKYLQKFYKSWEENFKDDKDILYLSYKKHAYNLNELIKIWDDKKLNIFVMEIKEIFKESKEYINFDEEQENITMLKNNCKLYIGEELSELIERYFYKNGEDDEIKANNRKERLFGISTGTMQKDIEMRGITIPQLYKIFLSTMDRGICALTVKKVIFHDRIVFCSVLNAGEQAYRIMIDKYMLLFQYLMKIENDMRGRIHNDNIFKEYLTEVEKQHSELNIDMKVVQNLINGMRKQKRKFYDMYVYRPELNDDTWQKNILENIYHQVMNQNL